MKFAILFQIVFVALLVACEPKRNSIPNDHGSNKDDVFHLYLNTGCQSFVFRRGEKIIYDKEIIGEAYAYHHLPNKCYIEFVIYSNIVIQKGVKFTHCSNDFTHTEYVYQLCNMDTLESRIYKSNDTIPSSFFDVSPLRLRFVKGSCTLTDSIRPMNEAEQRILESIRQQIK